MGVYVEIRKDQETDAHCIYRYTAPDGSVGLVELSKFDGSSKLLKLAEGDADQRRYLLVARKLLLHFREGQFPDETCWAS